MAGTFRRGFKTEAERFALSLRAELGLAVTDRLDCNTLAGHLEIPVISLQELRHHGASSQSVSRLMGRTSGFSALTIREGTRRLIVYNPRHPPTRRANSVVHEVSHVVLEHPPGSRAGRRRLPVLGLTPGGRSGLAGCRTAGATRRSLRLAAGGRWAQRRGAEFRSEPGTLPLAGQHHGCCSTTGCDGNNDELKPRNLRSRGQRNVD